MIVPLTGSIARQKHVMDFPIPLSPAACEVLFPLTPQLDRHVAAGNLVAVLYFTCTEEARQSKPRQAAREPSISAVVERTFADRDTVQ